MEVHHGLEDCNKPAPSLDQSSLELTEEYIRLRAYKLFEQRVAESMAMT
jgi:hypothetical protein